MGRVRPPRKGGNREKLAVDVVLVSAGEDGTASHTAPRGGCVGGSGVDCIGAGAYGQCMC